MAINRTGLKSWECYSTEHVLPLGLGNACPSRAGWVPVGRSGQYTDSKPSLFQGKPFLTSIMLMSQASGVGKRKTAENLAITAQRVWFLLEDFHMPTVPLLKNVLPDQDSSHGHSPLEF